MSGVTNSRINGIHVNGTCRLRGSIDKSYLVHFHSSIPIVYVPRFIYTYNRLYLFIYISFVYPLSFIYLHFLTATVTSL